MNIKISSEYQSEEYATFIESCESALIYSTPYFLKFLEKVTGGQILLILAYEEGGICGALPLCVKTNSKGMVINSLPWFGTYGGCVLKDEENEEVLSELLNRYSELLDELNPLSSTLIVNPFSKQKAVYESSIAFEHSCKDERICQASALPLDNDFDSYLMNVVKQKTRNLVRKASKQGFELVEKNDDEAWEVLYNLHFENMTKIGGKPKQSSHFDAIRECIPEANRAIYIAELEGVPTAAVLMFYYNETAEYITPVINVEYRSKQPLTFLIWELMQVAAKKGMRFWNWGGTWKTQESLHHFKAGWGAEDYKYNYYINTTDAGMSLIQNNINSLLEEFPYFYIYPSDMLKQEGNL